MKAAIDMVLEEAATRGHRPAVTAIERRLGIPHATFHRHYADLIDTHVRPAFCDHPNHGPGAFLRARRVAGGHPARLRKENTELRRTFTLNEEAIRQLAIANKALRTGATVIPLQARHRRISPPSS